MLPLLIAGGIVSLASTAAGWKVWSDYQDYEAFKKTIPANPMPNGPQTPSAPETRDEMLNWTPDMAAARQVQDFYKWRKGLFSNYPDDPAEKKGVDPWVIAGLVAVGVFVVAKKK